MTDTSDLVERMNIEASEDLDGEVRESAIEVTREAATALTAKDKEIEALRERVKDASRLAHNECTELVKQVYERAETAERERDEARAALKPMIVLAEDTAKKLRQCGSPMADKIDQLARAARAAIKQGE